MMVRLADNKGGFEAQDVDQPPRTKSGRSSKHSKRREDRKDDYDDERRSSRRGRSRGAAEH